MNINGITNSSIFFGAYNNRIASKRIDITEISAEKTNAIKEAIQNEMIEIKELKTGEVHLTISEEGRELLCSEEAQQKMQNDLEELYSKSIMKVDPNNPDEFWKNTSNQWLVFSEKLYQNGFYDNKSDEEVKQLEDMLAKITSGMDHMSRTLYNTGIELSDFYGKGNNYFMSSSEVKMELESAKVALHTFNEKYVNEELQDEFSDMIDMFYQHNKEISSEYKSPFETFNKAINAMHTGKIPNSQILSKYSQSMKNDNAEIDKAIFLGGISHSESETERFTNEIESLFKELSSQINNSEQIWKQIENVFVKYATKSNDKEIQDYVLEHSDFISRLKGYWSELI